MVGHPTGTVTFLFTDIEGSTRSWELAAGAMHAALARHDEIVRDAVRAHDGVVFATGGDGVAAAFASADEAIAAAIDAQANLGAVSWPGGIVLRVRMGLHTGAALERDGDYFGPVVNRAARIMAISHGGQILLSSTTAALLEPGRVRLIDLGEHRLKDLLAPEHLWQVWADETFPTVRSLGRRGRRLPVQLTAFVGRDQELVDAAAGVTQHRLTTLVGVGGMGKTRLALQVAAEMVEEFPDGVCFIDLAPVTSTAGVSEAVAAALGVEQGSAATLSDAIVAASASWRSLLIIDNCEHVIDTVASLGTRLLGTAPALRLLATSREALGIPGERVVAVGPLAVDGDQGRNDAVALLVDRVREQRPDLVWDATSVGAAEDICRRLDGIPLAIELAAARVRSMSLLEVASRLDERFRLLTRGARGAVSRHQTLQAAVDWSYDLLTPDEQRLWEWCSVFAGGFMLDAAEALAVTAAIDPHGVLDLLDALVGRSIVIADDRAGATRYRMLETIRQYGADRLAARGDLVAAADAHLAWMISFLGQFRDGVRQRGDQPWLARMTAELDNHAVAVAHAQGELRWRDLGELFAPLPVSPMFGLSSAATLARSATQVAQGHPAAATDPAWAPIAIWASFDCFHQANYPAGTELATAAAALVEHDPYLLTQSLLAGFTHLAFSGDYGGVDTVTARLLDIAGSHGSVYERVDAMGARSASLHVSGRSDEAHALALDAVAAAKQTGCQCLLVRALMFLGITVNTGPNLDVLIDDYDKAFQLAVKWRSTYDAAALFAALMRLDPDTQQNLRRAQLSLSVAADNGNVSAIAQSLMQVARCLQRAGLMGPAARLIGFAQTHMDASGFPSPEVEALNGPEAGEDRALGARLSTSDAIDVAEHALTEALAEQA